MVARECKGKDGEKDEVGTSGKISELVEFEGKGNAECDELVSYGYQPGDGKVVVVENVDGHVGRFCVVSWWLRDELKLNSVC